MSHADNDMRDKAGMGPRTQTPPRISRQDASDESLNLITAVHAMIGFCESLKPGTIITEGYMERMKEYYLPNLERAMAAIRQPDRESLTHALYKILHENHQNTDSYTAKLLADYLLSTGGSTICKDAGSASYESPSPAVSSTLNDLTLIRRNGGDHHSINAATKADSVHVNDKDVANIDGWFSQIVRDALNMALKCYEHAEFANLYSLQAVRTTDGRMSADKQMQDIKAHIESASHALRCLNALEGTAKALDHTDR